MHEILLDFSDTDGSPNHSKKTRPSDHQQKTGTCLIKEFVVSEDHRVKPKR